VVKPEAAELFHGLVAIGPRQKEYDSEVQNTRLARFHSLVTADPLPTINEETYSAERFHGLVATDL